jgi:hypothetical protein
MGVMLKDPMAQPTSTDLNDSLRTASVDGNLLETQCDASLKFAVRSDDGAGCQDSQHLDRSPSCGKSSGENEAAPVEAVAIDLTRERQASTLVEGETEISLLSP